MDALKPLVTIQSRLIRMGAEIPPPTSGKENENAFKRGISIALELVHDEMNKIAEASK